MPTEADAVITGSGMSGTSIAWHLLQETNGTTPLRIAMLDARQAYSGATGRNGGHIRPSSYSEYAGAKEAVAQEEAAKITRLRFAHVEALISAANSLPEDGGWPLKRELLTASIPSSTTMVGRRPSSRCRP